MMKATIFGVCSLALAGVASAAYGDDFTGVCLTGSSQSPMTGFSVDDSLLVNDLEVEADYAPHEITLSRTDNSGLRAILTENAVTANWKVSESSVTRNYAVEAVDFHWHSSSQSSGSEHTFEDETYVMEMQIRHSSSGGAITHIVAVLFELDDDDNADLDAVINNLEEIPYSNSADYAVPATTTLDLTTFFKKLDNPGFVRYGGSETTPVCSEDVVWYVLTDPSTVSEAQLDSLRALHADTGTTNTRVTTNVRPSQRVASSTTVTTNVKTNDNTNVFAGDRGFEHGDNTGSAVEGAVITAIVYFGVLLLIALLVLSPIISKAQADANTAAAGEKRAAAATAASVAAADAASAPPAKRVVRVHMDAEDDEEDAPAASVQAAAPAPILEEEEEEEEESAAAVEVQEPVAAVEEEPAAAEEPAEEESEAVAVGAIDVSIEE